MCKIMDKYLVEATIKTARKFNASETQIIETSKKEFHMSEQEAKEAI